METEETYQDESGEEGTPAEAAEETEPTEATAASDEPSDEPAGEPEPEEKKKDKVQDRFDELTRKRREAERDAAYWKGRAEALQGGDKEKVASLKEPDKPVGPPKPKEGDFEDYSEFVEALADWKTDQRLAKMEQDRTASEGKRTFETWKVKGKEKYPDFEAVALRQPDDGGPTISEGMAQVIHESSMSHDLAYWLGKNPEESLKIARMSPLGAAKEIGKLEVRLSAPAVGTKRTTTKAPAPIVPVTGDGSASLPDVERMNVAEYIAYKNRQEFGKK